jgi:hypothetical protein
VAASVAAEEHSFSFFLLSAKGPQMLNKLNKTENFDLRLK